MAPTLWARVRALFARIGSDPYYASYERSLGNIKAELQRTQVGPERVLGCCGTASRSALERRLAQSVGTPARSSAPPRVPHPPPSPPTHTQAARAARAKAWAAVRARFLAVCASAWVVLLAWAAWVNRQPYGTYTPTQQAARVAPALLAPALGWAAFRLLRGLQALLDRRAAARVKVLEAKLRKQVRRCG